MKKVVEIGNYLGICFDEVSPLQLRLRCFAGTLSQSRESTCGPGGPTSTDLMHSSPSFNCTSYFNRGFSNSFIKIFIVALLEHFFYFQGWKHDFLFLGPSGDLSPVMISSLLIGARRVGGK